MNPLRCRGTSSSDAQNNFNLTGVTGFISYQMQSEPHNTRVTDQTCQGAGETMFQLLSTNKFLNMFEMVYNSSTENVGAFHDLHLGSLK
jgi:hypothetical protein